MMLRRIYDEEDGDGVEDNVKKSYEELDRFYWPNRFNAAEEIYNTHHGNLPGHVRMEEYDCTNSADTQQDGSMKEKLTLTPTPTNTTSTTAQFRRIFPAVIHRELSVKSQSKISFSSTLSPSSCSIAATNNFPDGSFEDSIT